MKDGLQFIGFLEMEGDLEEELMDYNCQGWEIHSATDKFSESRFPVKLAV